MKIIEIETSKIKPYKLNAKTHSQTQIENVAESIKQFGFRQPIVLDKDYTIIIGHCRFEASKSLGLEKVPCVIADDLTDEQVKKLRIIDNKTNESEWNIENLFEDVKDLDFDGFVLDLGLPEEEKEAVEDDFDIETNLPEIPNAKRGDVYKLGNHYLMCGDSTSEDDVAKLMSYSDKKEADLLFTDPPYNVNISNSQGMTIENDFLEENEFKQFLNKAMKNASKSLKLGGAFYVWHGDSESIAFRTCCLENELLVKQCLIWVKNGFTFGRQDYKWQHEPCLYGWKDGAGHYFCEEYNHPTVLDDNIDINKLSKEELKDIVTQMRENTKTTIIRENKPLKNDLHPTMKPIKMCADLITHSTKKGEIVLDLFGGSGSTMIACEQIDRVCYMIEYDPVYVDVIIKRWEQLTGKKAIKIA